MRSAESSVQEQRITNVFHGGGYIFTFPNNNLFLMQDGGSEMLIAGFLFTFYRWQEQSLSRIGSLFQVIQTAVEGRKIAKPIFFLSQCLVNTHRRVKIVFAGTCLRAKEQ